MNCEEQAARESPSLQQGAPRSTGGIRACIWLHRLLESRCHYANRTQHTSSSFGARTDWRGVCGTTHRLDADATISVDVGAHSGGDWACA